MSTHSIRRVYLEVNRVGKTNGLALLEETSAWANDTLLAQIEQVFASLPDSEELIQIERLELELNSSSASNWGNEILARLKWELSAMLLRISAERTHLKSEDKLQPQESFFRNLVYFLQQGILPWSSAIRSRDNWVASTDGVFTFSLAVTQSKTGAQAISNSIKVTVKKVEQPPPPPVKTCGNLALIIDGFSKLKTIDTEQNFAAFSQLALDELGINPFFRELAAVSTVPEEEQLGFFSPAVQDRIMGWLDRLASLIRSVDLRNLRMLSLETYRLLVDLVMYISCIQKNDQDVNTQVLEMIGGHLVDGNLLLRDPFSTQERDSLAHLGSDIKDELNRQIANNEIQPKPNYTNLLQKLLDLFRV